MKRLPTEQRRKQIAEAALRIIAERGLRSFTVAAISEEVGLADGTIFRHFDDKDDIVLEAVTQLEETLMSQVVEPPKGDPLKRLGAFLRMRIELIQKRPEIFKVLFSDDLAKAGPEEAGRRVRELKHRSMQLVRAHLQMAIDQGLVAPDCTADELLYIVHGTALAQVFSGSELGEVTDGAVSPEAIWSCVERLLRAR